MPRINIELDEVLHKALRVRAIKEGMTMSEAIEKAIGLYVEESSNER